MLPLVLNHFIIKIVRLGISWKCEGFLEKISLEKKVILETKDRTEDTKTCMEDRLIWKKVKSKEGKDDS